MEILRYGKLTKLLLQYRHTSTYHLRLSACGLKSLDFKPIESAMV